MKKSFTIGLLIAWVAIIPEVLAGPPKSFSYNSKEYQTNVATPGSTPAPRIDWGGQTGTFQLADKYEGVSLNTNTGVVSWTKNLPLQENTITVIAKNASGQIQTQFVINHIFEGTFRGGYNNDPRSSSISGNSFSMTFTPLNKIFVHNGTSNGTGQWGINNFKKIVGRYSYGQGAFYVFEGNMRISKDGEPFIMGYWKAENSPNWQGYYSIVFESHNLSETESPQINTKVVAKAPMIVANPTKENPAPEKSKAGPVPTTKILVAGGSTSGDATNTPGAPSNLKYPNTKFDVDYLKQGDTFNASVDWGKERGRFYSPSPLTGTKVDPNTGIIMVDNKLPIGEHNILVVAENSAGKSSTNLKILHYFHGEFKGGYSGSANSKAIQKQDFYLVFYADGTIQTEDHENNKKLLGNGNWKYGPNNTITGTFDYYGERFFEFNGTVIFQNTSTPYITGYIKTKGKPSWEKYFRIEYTGNF